MTTTTGRIVIADGRVYTSPAKALLPPPPPFQPRLVLRGAARYVGLMAAAWAIAAVTAVAVYGIAVAVFRAVSDIATTYP